MHKQIGLCVMCMILEKLCAFSSLILAMTLVNLGYFRDDYKLPLTCLAGCVWNACCILVECVCVYMHVYMCASVCSSRVCVCLVCGALEKKKPTSNTCKSSVVS